MYQFTQYKNLPLPKNMNSNYIINTCVLWGLFMLAPSLSKWILQLSFYILHHKNCGFTGSEHSDNCWLYQPCLLYQQSVITLGHHAEQNWGLPLIAFRWRSVTGSLKLSMGCRWDHMGGFDGAKRHSAIGTMPTCCAPLDQRDAAHMEEAHCCLSTTTAGQLQHAAGQPHCMGMHQEAWATTTREASGSNRECKYFHAYMNLKNQTLVLAQQLRDVSS